MLAAKVHCGKESAEDEHQKAGKNENDNQLLCAARFLGGGEGVVEGDGIEKIALIVDGQVRGLLEKHADALNIRGREQRDRGGRRSVGEDPDASGSDGNTRTCNNNRWREKVFVLQHGYDAIFEHRNERGRSTAEESVVVKIEDKCNVERA